MRHFLFFLILSALLVGCGGSGSNSTTNNKVGPKLGLKSTGSEVLHNTVSNALHAAPGDVDFELGDLKVTKRYLFLLQNTGSSNATNVVLTSSDPNVTITPSTIGVITPSGTGGVVPVIEVEVLHGRGPSGYGTHATLEAGRNEFTVSATSAENVNFSASMAVDVKVANFEILVNGSNILDTTATGFYQQNVSNQAVNSARFSATLYDYPTASIDGSFGTNLIAPGPYELYGMSGVLSVHNTGNVPIILKQQAHAETHSDPNYVLQHVAADLVIAVGQTVTVPGYTAWVDRTTYPLDGASFMQHFFTASSEISAEFCIDSDNTSFDSSLPSPDNGVWGAEVVVTFETVSG